MVVRIQQKARTVTNAISSAVVKYYRVTAMSGTVIPSPNGNKNNNSRNNNSTVSTKHNNVVSTSAITNVRTEVGGV
jgi:hypothetical protein